MSKRKKSKIPSSSPKANRIPQQKSPENEIIFDFSYSNWIKSYSNKSKDFTSYLKDDSMYAEYITKILNKLIPTITKEWSPQKNSQFQHCHEIPTNDEAFQKYKIAIQDLHRIDAEQLSLWQFGLNGSIRLICNFSSNRIFPLLIDYHHLGYSSKKYNQKDYKKYKFCPVEEYS
ncbi:hypothetical protein AB3329_08065 [Streptococcus sp. H31]|uniref:hypothetical protein n=1 Tax=Streptococcus huangxiaojuni TaxID=3237239 RepID=UPI0034A4484F